MTATSGRPGADNATRPAAARASQTRRRRAMPAGPGATVFDFDRARIERALPQRARYKYVQPHVEAEAGGWKIVSANCSRNVHRDGGQIDIAWFERAADGRWNLHARDHAAQAWTLKAQGLSLTDALALVCEDTGREYWQ
jgi:hypothetical protein